MPTDSISNGRPRLFLQGVILVGCLVAVVWIGQRFLSDSSILPPDDFVEYWAAGRLNANGQNPYDGKLLLPLERDAGRDTDEAVMMWNPPWTLTLAMPIGLMKPRLAQLIWLVISLTIVIGCSDRLWLEYGGSTKRRWISWALALTFVPTLFVLQAGQIGPFILLGITGFLVAERRGLPWLAGAFGVLMAIKPHLVYLFWISLAVWAACRPLPNRWKVIAGGVIAGIIATAIPMASNPDVLGQYWHAMTQETPTQWKSPTIGSYLRAAVDESWFKLQYVPMLIGVAWLAIAAWRSRRHIWSWPERLPLLLLVSFVTASYGAWPFDVVILLPAILQVAADLARSADRARVFAALAAYASINVAALVMNGLGITSDKFVWLAPSLLVAYLLLRPKPAAP
jgi:hypothetical protein